MEFTEFAQSSSQVVAASAPGASTDMQPAPIAKGANRQPDTVTSPAKRQTCQGFLIRISVSVTAALEPFLGSPPPFSRGRITYFFKITRCVDSLGVSSIFACYVLACTTNGIVWSPISPTQHGGISFCFSSGERWLQVSV